MYQNSKANDNPLELSIWANENQVSQNMRKPFSQWVARIFSGANPLGYKHGIQWDKVDPWKSFEVIRSHRFKEPTTKHCGHDRSLFSWGMNLVLWSFYVNFLIYIWIIFSLLNSPYLAFSPSSICLKKSFKLWLW